ncbi:MAG TPA: hypothetical protein PK771_12580 [Spirochaetota bacterium]|nr:hypothetical protein [Spirochaetota bacterium]
MKEESKKDRFIRFLDETLSKSVEDIKPKFEAYPFKEPLNLKLKIKNLGYSRFVSFNENNLKVTDKPTEKVDCLIYFENAKVAHQILLRKILPYNSALIGKYDIKYFNEKSRIFATIYGPAKNNYCNIIKGTRFTLKKD